LYNVNNNKEINKDYNQNYIKSSDSVYKNSLFISNNNKNAPSINNSNVENNNGNIKEINKINSNSENLSNEMSGDHQEISDINLNTKMKEVTQSKKVTFVDVPHGNTRVEKHINMVQKLNIKPYNLIEDIANTKCNINMGQLLDLVPKARSDLTKSLRADKIKLVSSIDFSEDSNKIPNKDGIIKDEDTGLVKCKVDNTPGRLLIDSGSNLNLISTSYLNSLPGQYEQVGYCRGLIYEALGDNTVADAIVVRLTLHINNFSFTANFCVVEHDTMYFDLLIGLKTIFSNSLFIHPLIKCHSLSIPR